MQQQQNLTIFNNKDFLQNIQQQYPAKSIQPEIINKSI